MSTITYLARAADGCWHLVTTPWKVWATLPRIAGVSIAWAANCIVPSHHASPPPQHVEAPQPFHPPGSTFYYPPSWYRPSGPDAVRPVHYVPEDDDHRKKMHQAPEPATLAVFGVGILGLAIIRGRRT